MMRIDLSFFMMRIVLSFLLSFLVMSVAFSFASIALIEAVMIEAKKKESDTKLKEAKMNKKEKKRYISNIIFGIILLCVGFFNFFFLLLKIVLWS